VPGVVGLITKMSREWAEPQLMRMVEALRHESFYVTGTWIDESLGVYVGWVARENSFSDGMPIRNEHDDVVLIFSGENYPEPGTARRLKERGHECDVEGPSYLVHVYEEDPSFPRSLNGRFHGLVADRVRGAATLFNDRYGMDRLYYHESKDAFYFSAEAKAILMLRPELRTANLKSLGEFVACGCVLENRTLFEGIQVLPGGSAWTFRSGSIEKRNTYFAPREWEQQGALDAESYYLGLRDTLSRNLPRYFNGGSPMAISLTGGLDTRVIMAWQKARPGSLPSYTFGGAFRECQDVLVARRVAEACHQPHSVITVGEKFLSRFPHYAERSLYLTDACVDVSRSSDLFVSEEAREIAPVKIVGTYGSEVIRQARMFKPTEPTPGLIRSELLSHVHQARATYGALIRENPVTFAAFRQSPWHHYGVVALEQSQLTVRSPFLDNDFVQTVFRAPSMASEDSDVRLRLIRDGDEGLGRIPSDRGVGGGSRYPFTLASRGLLEFTFKAEYAYDYGMPQWVSRIDHFFSPLRLERLFLGRHKLCHYRVWYRDALSGYVREMLLDRRTLSRPYLEPKRVEAVVNGHLKGGLNFTGEIHRLLSLELLHRLFLDAR
jgi:asparagine synthase (glutamine-hydrolysing)